VNFRDPSGLTAQEQDTQFPDHIDADPSEEPNSGSRGISGNPTSFSSLGGVTGNPAHGTSSGQGGRSGRGGAASDEEKDEIVVRGVRRNSDIQLLNNFFGPDPLQGITLRGRCNSELLDIGNKTRRFASDIGRTGAGITVTGAALDGIGIATLPPTDAECPFGFS